MDQRLIYSFTLLSSRRRATDTLQFQLASDIDAVRESFDILRDRTAVREVVVSVGSERILSRHRTSAQRSVVVWHKRREPIRAPARSA